MTTPLHVLHVAAECAPWAKVGGLADVVGALPAALARRAGVSASIVLPRYADLEPGAEPILDGAVTVRGRALAWSLRRAAPATSPVALYLVEADSFREGGIYGPGALERQAVLGAAARDLAIASRAGDLPGVAPVHVAHVHDHHPAFTALGLRHGGAAPRVPVVVTVHNARYHGDHAWEDVAGLVPATADRGDCDHAGRFNSLKAAVLAADLVTTVSPTHARELAELPAASRGLDYAFHRVGERLVGILNGIDTDVWDPAHDASLAATFSADDLSGKAKDKAALCAAHGLDAARPLLAFVGRLVPEKGIDALLGAVPLLAEREPDAQILVLGTGEARYEEALRALADAPASRLRTAARHDETLAHHVYAGADVLLMPSWHEPCGLAQMYALRYGTVPVVHPTGGLRDSVEPFDEATGRGTGFWLEGANAGALAEAVSSALAAWRRPAAWRTLQQNGLRADLSWEASAAHYVECYRRNGPPPE